VYIANSKLRRLLRRYANGEKATKGEKFAKLTQDEKLVMLQQAELVSLPLHNFLLYIDSSSAIAPQPVQQFLLSLASNSPVCSYIHPKPAVKVLLDQLCSGVNVKEDPSAWKLLSEEVPLVYSMIADASTTTVPKQLCQLLQELWEKAASIFMDSELYLDPDSTGSSDNVEMAHFPNLPLLRSRGFFAADAANSKSMPICRKQYPGHPTLLPVIFTIYCPHGIKYLYLYTALRRMI
jgi:hypothetical protein